MRAYSRCPWKENGILGTPQRGKFHCILINPHTSLGLDLIPGFICFFVGLFSELDYGIFAGMGVHLAMVLYQIARPKVEVEVKVLDRTGTDYIFISPDQGGHEHLNIDRGFLFSPLIGKSCFRSWDRFHIRRLCSSCSCFDQGIIFPSATHIRALISKVGIKQVIYIIMFIKIFNH